RHPGERPLARRSRHPARVAGGAARGAQRHSERGGNDAREPATPLAAVRSAGAVAGRVGNGVGLWREGGMNVQLISVLAQIASEPDQETVWKLETHWTWAPWFTVLFIVAVVVGIAYLYSRESSPAGRFYRGLLATLRL